MLLELGVHGVGLAQRSQCNYVEAVSSETFIFYVFLLNCIPCLMRPLSLKVACWALGVYGELMHSALMHSL